MDKKNYKRYMVLGITVFVVIALSIVLFFILFKARGVGEAFGNLARILRPVIYGIAMAYVLNPVFRRAEGLLTRLLGRWLKSSRYTMILARVLSTALTLVITFTVLIGLFYLVMPQFAVSVFGVIEKMPLYLTDLRQWAGQVMEENPYVGPLVMDAYQSMATYTEQWLRTELVPLVGGWAGRAYGGLLIAVTTLFNLFVGVIVMVYLLNGKNTFAAQGKKLLYSALPPQKANLVIENIRYIHRVFGGFINGQLLDSLIVGFVCFIFLKLTHMPYALLITVIISVTNLIPFFGPFLGVIPSAILLLFESPMMCIYFSLFMLVFFQIDGNIINPKILGGTTGLPSFWVLFSILLFGGLFGFVGMIVAVPVFALLYSIIKALADRGLSKRGLPTDTDSYRGLHHIEPDGPALVKENVKCKM